MPKGQPRAGAIWADSPGLALAQRRAQELLGPIAVAREARLVNVKHCEVGYSDMTAPALPWPRPLIVLGAGATWFAAFAAADRALADPAVRAEAERHDELLAALVAQRRAERAEQAEKAALEAPAEAP
jgi:hypothetical protein